MVPQSDINAAFEAWLDATEPCDPPEASEQGLRYRRLGHALAVVESESNYLVLCRIETVSGHRGEGQANQLLSLLKSISDRYHVTLLGQATAYDDQGLGQRALLDWYARRGFEIDSERTTQPLVWYPCRPV